MSDTPGVYVFEWAKARRLVLKTIIGAVIAAAAIAIGAVIAGSFNILEAKLLVIVLLFIAFTLFSLFDAEVVSKSSERFALTGVVVNVYLLLAGALKVGVAHGSGDSLYNGDGQALGVAFWQWVLLVLIARGAVGVAQLTMAEKGLYRYNALEGLSSGTVAMVTLLGAMLSFPVLFDAIHYAEIYWRLVGVAVILTVLGLVLIPLVGRFFGERLAAPAVITGTSMSAGEGPRVVGVARPAAPATFDENGVRVPAAAQAATTPEPAAVQQESVAVKVPKRLAWPRFEDGTPLPQGPDGKPDYSVLNQN